eukprot:3937370-Rhodomonas_salina.2
MRGACGAPQHAVLEEYATTDAEKKRQREFEEEFQCGAQVKVFETDVGGTSCACSDEWDPSRFWEQLFLGRQENWMYPNVLRWLCVYIFLQNSILTLLTAYLQASLRILSTGIWSDIDDVPAPYDSWVRQTLLSGCLAIVCGRVIVKHTNVTAFIDMTKTLQWRVWMPKDASTPVRFVLAVSAYGTLDLCRQLLYTLQTGG